MAAYSPSIHPPNVDTVRTPASRTSGAGWGPGSEPCRAGWGALTRGAVETTDDSSSPPSPGDPQLPCLILKPQLWKMPAHRTVQSGTWPAEGSCLRCLLLCSHSPFIPTHSVHRLLLFCLFAFHFSTGYPGGSNRDCFQTPLPSTLAQDEAPSSGMGRKKCQHPSKPRAGQDMEQRGLSEA